MDITFNRNEDIMKLSLSEMRKRLEKIYEGGGKKAIEKQHSQQKLSPRERLAYLLDKDAPFLEIGAFVPFVTRPLEFGSGRTVDISRDAAFDFHATDFLDLASQLGC